MTIINRPTNPPGNPFTMQNAFKSAIDGQAAYPLTSVGQVPFIIVAQDGTGDYSDLQTAFVGVGAGIFFVKGDYTITANIHNTNPNQTVIFDGYHSIIVASGFAFDVIYVGSDSNMAGSAIGNVYNNCRWIGNGTTISLTTTSGHKFFSVSSSYNCPQAPLVGIEVGGFTYTQNGNTGFIGVISFNGTQQEPTAAIPDNLLTSQVWVHDVYMTITGTVAGSTPISYGGIKNVETDRVYIDGSGIGTGQDYSLTFANNAASGGYPGSLHTYNITFNDCSFISNGASGQICELKGGGGSNTGTLQAITEFITYRQCSFFAAGVVSDVYAGQGGIEIDDNISGGGNTFVRNLDFEMCSFTYVGVTYQANASYFGYIRYTGQIPSTSGTMTGRSVGSTVTITPGASPYTYTNTDGIDEYVSIDGGTVTDIRLDGMAVGLASGAWYLTSGHTLTVTYSTAPTMLKQGIRR